MPQRTQSRRMYTRLLLFSLAGFALWALGRNRPETHDRAPETVDIYGAQANDTKNTRARERSSYSKRRLATSLTFATLFFAGAALSAGAGDTVAEMMEGSDAPAAAETTTEATESSPAAGGESQTQALTATEENFSISLDKDTLTAGTYEITVVNNGSATHDLAVEEDGTTEATSDSIAPGESTTMTVDLDAGEYVFYCSIGNHRAMGMEITVQVT